MKKLTCLILVLVMSMGCAPVQSRMIRLKNRGENVLTVKVSGSLEEAKNAIREITKEMNLVEVKEAEKDNFMFIRTNLARNFSSALLFGPIGGSMVSDPTRIGFFFDVDQGQNMTTVTIAEEVSTIVKPSRFTIGDKLRLKFIDKVAKFPHN